MTNKEFLFIFDASLSNPNGDPDQENKPRMDRATKTNLVSDTRLKRNIRDYLINKFNGGNTENDIFVRMMGENKVSVDKRLMGVMASYVLNREKLLPLIDKHKNLLLAFQQLKERVEIPEKPKKGEVPKPPQPFKGDYFDLYQKYFKADDFKSAPDKDKAKYFDVDEISSVNNELLIAIIKDIMIDIRFFGSAVAVKGFSRTITGPIQINFGYSFHPVELSDSNTTVTLMSGSTEGESNIGKKEKLKYSLIGYTGTINSNRAKIVGLKDEDDLNLFRESMILSLLNNDSDSKKNQYPRLYLEIDYNDKEIYGRLGDLRTLIDVKPKQKDDSDKLEDAFTKVRSIEHIILNFDRLIDRIEKIKGRIKTIRIWTSLDGICDPLRSGLETKIGKEQIQTLEI